ncbi:efflux transporter outer membrane subunit [Lysobacter auxotrophicus]|uniref:Efflux transporter outer membrane subunit n=1 Tax=Lysobacter auxotrophicus TaxID=2992573 RepID=A0ABM8DDN7_9GAMM|nr:efflux transporter outer membrane subunit [Lysobacter auxotrophicus]BDU16705.1 efflux transporter outer membrane subunit [Lysobacter auxotrophicus]
MVRHAAIATALLLAGCNLAPTYERPPATIESRFPAAATAGVQPAANAAQLHWSAFFADPVLREYVGLALENNRDLGAATARIAQAQAQFRIQRSQQFPALDATAAGQRQRGPVSPVEGAPRVTVDSVAVQVAVPAFELDFWGRVANLSEAARRQYLATVEAQRAFRLSLISNVASTYYAIRSSEEGIVLAEASLQSRNETLELARIRMEAGVTSSIDYNQAYALVAQAQTQLAQLHRSRELAQHRLQVLVGVPLPDPLPPGLRVEAAIQAQPLAPGLPSELLENRPDLRLAEERLRAANANIGAARALYLPTIALTGAGGYASSELSNLVSDPNRVWSFGIGAVLPIFDWGRRRAAVNLAKATRDELELQYQSAAQNAFREVADGLSAEQRNREQIQAQELTVRIQRELADTAQARYEVGLTPYLEVLDAQRNLFSAEQGLLQLRASALQDRVNLYTALGGGDDTIDSAAYGERVTGQAAGPRLGE